MILNSLFKKSALAVIFAYGGVAWLNIWHQYNYSRSALVFPPISNWLRDSLILLLPVMLAVWAGIALAQWLINRSGERMSLSTQYILTAAILGVVTSVTIIVMENTRIFFTGLGNEIAILASICRNLYPDGNFLLNNLQKLFSDYQAIRLHILLQDGFNLALVNLTITVVLILILEGSVSLGKSHEMKAQLTL